MFNESFLQTKKIGKNGMNLNKKSEVLIDKKLDAFFKEGKDAIEKFFKRKCERYKKLNQMKKELNTKRMQEDFNRGIEDIQFEKERKISKFEEALDLISLNKKLKLKNDEELIPDEIISLNENSDDDLDIIYSNSLKNKRKKLFSYNK